jgi:DNA helicase IV
MPITDLVLSSFTACRSHSESGVRYFVRFEEWQRHRGERAIGKPGVRPTNDDGLGAELAVEQSHISLLYEHLDEMRDHAATAFADAIRSPTVGTPGARSERDAFVSMYADRVSQLQAVEQRLCFGRLDLVDGSRRYVGRIGISDEHRQELLVDWRAPAAEPFYQATAAHPHNVVRRRQLTTHARRVTGVQDEVLDLAAFELSGVAGGHIVLGEGALFASLEAARSGRMNDIVATIQADQDRAIRAPLDGVFVVQGGPGTGKTAVALHRTAFLLYANRQRMARSGVLLVGPNRVFLGYIEQVLPALGEAEAVVMATPGELYPGVATDVQDPPELAALKGDIRMAEVLSAAVRQRQRTIDQPRLLDVDGRKITLYPRDIRLARDRARRSGEPHNQARVAFVAEILRELVRRLAGVRGVELDPDVRASLMAELHDSPDVRRELNLCWGPVSPSRLLRDLYADPARLAAAGAGLTPAERTSLHRSRNAPWTVSDVALLDEAAELLGLDDSDTHTESARAEADRAAEVAYADMVQDTFGGKDFITAAGLADRYRTRVSLGSVAERAVLDREWSFGHIVVDEAQELSPMMWRLLMRRSPSHSMTVVGDVAQTGSLAGANSWADVLRPHVGERWSLAELTVNYRTPAQIMEVAAAVLHAARHPVVVPKSARPGRWAPVYTALDAEPVSSVKLPDVVRAEWELADAGTVAVITPRKSHAGIARAVARALPEGVVVSDTDALASPVSVLAVADAKGLEFDTVVLVEPSAIIAESPRGFNDLYVALTRPTQRLHVVHFAGLPEGMG